MKRWILMCFALWSCAPFGGAGIGSTDSTDAAVDVTDNANADGSTTTNDGSADAAINDDGGTDAGAACTLVTHNNGLGQQWTDCVPLGTINETQALKACAAFDAGPCDNNVTGCGTEQMVRPMGNNTLWEYQGVGAGHVSVSTCTGLSDPAWN